MKLIKSDKDNNIYSFSFDYVITKEDTGADVEDRILNELELIDGIVIEGNPGINDESWTVDEYGYNGNTIDGLVHQFNFDFSIRSDDTVDDVNDRIVREIELIDSIEVIGNPGINQESWSREEYGISSSRRPIKSSQYDASLDELTELHNIEDEIFDYVSPSRRYITHDSIKGYYEGDITAGDASDIINDINTRLSRLNDYVNVLISSIEEGFYEWEDAIDSIKQPLEAAKDICGQYLTDKDYAEIDKDIFQRIENFVNNTRNSSNSVESSYIVGKQINNSVMLYCDDNCYHDEHDMCKPSIKIFNSKSDADKIAKRSKTCFVRQL